MRRLATVAAVTLVTMAFGIPIAWAGSPHFVDSTVTATRTDNTLTVSGKEAGLGDEAQVHIVVTATAEYINLGGNHPKAANKGSVSTAGDFPVQNGKANFSLTLTATFQPDCTPPMTVVFTDVVVTDTTNGISQRPFLWASRYPACVPAVDAVVVDFDGTACSVDVAERLLIEFGDPSWPEFDAAVDRGAIGLRDAILAQNGMLRATREELLDFAIANGSLDPTFGPFAEWTRAGGMQISIASDGFGFYVRPILDAAGLGWVPVVTNEQRFDAEGRPDGLDFVSGHPECIGCGTCKMLAVQRMRADHGAVAFIGEGQTDRYGALYADLVFAKDALPAYCEQDGVPYLPWTDFDDVRRALEATTEVPGPVAPAVCPGWTTTGRRRV